MAGALAPPYVQPEDDEAAAPGAGSVGAQLDGLAWALAQPPLPHVPAMARGRGGREVSLAVVAGECEVALGRSKQKQTVPLCGFPFELANGAVTC